jgi:hypothetical protein
MKYEELFEGGVGGTERNLVGGWEGEEYGGLRGEVGTGRYVGEGRGGIAIQNWTVL